MIPTPQQINQAIQNHHRPYRTHGARIRDAMEHVRLSRKTEPAEAGLQSPVAGHHATREGRHGC